MIPLPKPISSRAAAVSMLALAVWTPGLTQSVTRPDPLPPAIHAINPDSAYPSGAAFDVDRDGDVDIVSGGWWYEAPAWKRHFVREVEWIRGRYDDYSNLPLDVDGDGWTDLVSANYRSATIYWIEHPGAGLGPWEVHVVEKPGPMETARLADVDGDGRLDLLPNGTTFAAWWEVAPGDAAKGRAPRWVRHELPRQIIGHGIGFGDVDGDGRGDLVGPRGWLRAPEDRRGGTWTWNGDFDLGPDASIPILVEDADRDGDADLIWGRGHRFGIHWLEQSKEAGGKRRWTRHAIDSSWSQAHSLLAADFDGDGRSEVVAGSRYLGHDGKDPGEYDAGVIATYAFDPKTRAWDRRLLSRDPRIAFGLDPKAVDIDGDGDLDLLAADRSGLYLLESRSRDGDAAPAPRAAVEAPPQDHRRPLLLRERGEGGAVEESAVRDPFAWARRRDAILEGLEEAMGELPEPSRRAPLEVEVVEETRTERYTRRKITYAPEPGDRVPAYLLIPHGLEGRAPAMLCLHQTTKIGKGEPAGLGGLESLRYAHELASRGYVCLAPDYPSFGDYPYDFKTRGAHYASGSMKAIWNNIRAVDLLEALPEVDPDRIGAAGHSLGGHNAIFSAVFDQRLCAIASSCGFNAFHHYYGGKLAGWTSDRYMPRIREVYKNDPDLVPFDFHELIAALAPRPVFVNAPLHDDNFAVAGVREAIERASEVYRVLGAEGELTARYPDCGHEFPAELREEFYRWLDGKMKRR